MMIIKRFYNWNPFILLNVLIGLIAFIIFVSLYYYYYCCCCYYYDYYQPQSYKYLHLQGASFYRVVAVHLKNARGGHISALCFTVVETLGPVEGVVFNAVQQWVYPSAWSS